MIFRHKLHIGNSQSAFTFQINSSLVPKTHLEDLDSLKTKDYYNVNSTHKMLSFFECPSLI